MTYAKHQAFNAVYKELTNEPNTGGADFDVPKKYHHAPKKLAVFSNYRGYIRWANELYDASSKLVIELKHIYNKSRKESSSWYNSKNSLNNILKELDKLESSLEDLYDDILEFQRCMLATGISEKQAEIEALSDHLRHLGSLETKIIETCNRKLYEITSSQMTLASIIVALSALFVSIVSLYCS